MRALAELPGRRDLARRRATALIRYQNGRFTRFGSRQRPLRNRVRLARPDGAGGLWVRNDHGAVPIRRGPRALLSPRTPGRRLDGPRRSTGIARARSGSRRSSGLYGLRDGRLVQFTTQTGLASDDVLSVFEDREGSLWIGTFDGGLNRLKDQRIANYTIRDGLTDNKIWTVFEDPIRRPVGRNRERRAVAHAPGRVPLRVGPRLRRPHHHDRGGLVGRALARHARQGALPVQGAKWVRYGVEEGLPGALDLVDLRNEIGTVWMAILGGGLVRFDDGRSRASARTRGFRRTPRCPSSRIAGDLWVGTYGGGVARLHEGRFQVFTTT